MDGRGWNVGGAHDQKSEEKEKKGFSNSWQSGCLILLIIIGLPVGACFFFYGGDAGVSRSDQLIFIEGECFNKMVFLGQLNQSDKEFWKATVRGMNDRRVAGVYRDCLDIVVP